MPLVVAAVAVVVLLLMLRLRLHLVVTKFDEVGEPLISFHDKPMDLALQFLLLIVVERGVPIGMLFK